MHISTTLQTGAITSKLHSWGAIEKNIKDACYDTGILWYQCILWYILWSILCIFCDHNVSDGLYDATNMTTNTTNITSF